MVLRTVIAIILAFFWEARRLHHRPYLALCDSQSINEAAFLLIPWLLLLLLPIDWCLVCCTRKRAVCECLLAVGWKVKKNLRNNCHEFSPFLTPFALEQPLSLSFLHKTLLAKKRFPCRHCAMLYSHQTALHTSSNNFFYLAHTTSDMVSQSCAEISQWKFWLMFFLVVVHRLNVVDDNVMNLIVRVWQ